MKKVRLLSSVLILWLTSCDSGQDPGSYPDMRDRAFLDEKLYMTIDTSFLRLDSCYFVYLTYTPLYKSKVSIWVSYTPSLYGTQVTYIEPNEDTISFMGVRDDTIVYRIAPLHYNIEIEAGNKVVERWKIKTNNVYFDDRGCGSFQANVLLDSIFVPTLAKYVHYTDSMAIELAPRKQAFYPFIYKFISLCP